MYTYVYMFCINARERDVKYESVKERARESRWTLKQRICVFIFFILFTACEDVFPLRALSFSLALSHFLCLSYSPCLSRSFALHLICSHSLFFSLSRSLSLSLSLFLMRSLSWARTLSLSFFPLYPFLPLFLSLTLAGKVRPVQVAGRPLWRAVCGWIGFEKPSGGWLMSNPFWNPPSCGCFCAVCQTYTHKRTHTYTHTDTHTHTHTQMHIHTHTCVFA